MSVASLEASLRGYVKAIRPTVPDNLQAASDFRLDWGLDSLDLFEFVARIERDFHLPIPDEDLPQFISLEATLQYLQARLPP